MKSLFLAALLLIGSHVRAQSLLDSIQVDNRFTTNVSRQVPSIVADRNAVYLAGGRTVGSTTLREIGKWDGFEWQSLPFDTVDYVGALALDSSGNLYTASGFMRKFDGHTWSVLDSLHSMSATVMAAHDSSVYGGGDKFLWFDGREVHDLSDPFIAENGSDINIQQIAVKGDTVFIAGYFKCKLANGDTAVHLVKWDGKQFSKLPLLCAPFIKLTVIDSMLYVVGEVDTSDRQKWVGGAVWNGRQWLNPGPPFSNCGEHFVRYHDTLYTIDYRGLRFWDGNAWIIRDSTLHGNILFTFKDKVGVAASMGDRPSDTVAVPGLVFWDGSKLSNPWQRPMLGLDGSKLNALCTYQNQLVAVGRFDATGTTYAHNIAAWNGESWKALTHSYPSFFKNLDDSLDYTIDEYGSASVIGNDLYLGGRFRQVDGIPANCIARFDGTKWYPLGVGIRGNTLSPMVQCIEPLADGSLVVGGADFYSAGGLRTTSLARWDGLRWHAFDTTVSCSVNALASHGDTIYAGGRFITDTLHHVMQIVGDEWQVIGDDLNNDVTALLRDHDTLFAAGYFTSSGATQLGHVARWDGTSWRPVGAGIPDPVVMLKKVGNKLFAAGHANWADYLYEWTGSEWRTVGPRTNNAILDVAYYQNGLCLGGAFTSIGDTDSYRFGMLHLPAGYLSAPRAKGAGQVTVWPNPASTTLSVAGFGQGVDYRIYNDLGSEVGGGRIGARGIEVNALAAGPYLLIIDSAEGRFSAPFAVQR